MRNLIRQNDADDWRWYKDSENQAEWFISVTKVLDVWTPAKVKNWIKNNSAAAQEKILTASADIGTRIHSAIELDLKGEKPDVTGIEQPFENWLVLKQEHGIKATLTESTVYSEQLGCAGTVDILGEFDGSQAIMDIKTGFYGIKAGPQMACYHFCAHEAGLIKPDCKVIGLSIHRDGRIAKPLVYEHLDWIFKTFTSCLELFKAENFYKLQKMDWKWLHNNSNKYSTKENA